LSGTRQIRIDRTLPPHVPTVPARGCVRVHACGWMPRAESTRYRAASDGAWQHDLILLASALIKVW